MNCTEPKKCRRYTISVGMNDKDSHEQRFDSEKIVKLAHNCCRAYGCAYSTSLIDGGYIHENGDYVVEKSIAITLIDPEEAVVEELAKDLCAFLHQESVMISVDEVTNYFLCESL